MTEPMTPCGKAGGHRCACCLSMEKRWADLHAEEVVKSIALRDRSSRADELLSRARGRLGPEAFGSEEEQQRFIAKIDAHRKGGS